MALSGTLNSTDYNGRYVQFAWTATQNIAKNQSTISWTLKGAGDAPNKWYKAGPFYVAIAGTKVYESSTRIELYKGTTIASGTKTITHDSDGSKNFSVSIKAAIYSASYNCTGSKTFTLTDIPRAATITSASNFNDEGSPTMKYSNPAGSAATVQVGLFWDSSTALVGYSTVTGTSGTKTWTLTTAQKNAIYSKLASKKSATIYYYIKTTVGGETFTSRVAKTVSITNATPTLSPTAIENDSRNITATGSNTRWVKGFSDVAYTFGASAKKGASIKSYKVECGSKSATASGGNLHDIDSGSVKFTVTDSRGNTATQTLNRTLVDYVKLTCNLTVSMTLETSATSVATLKFSGNFFNGNLKASAVNTLKLWYRYKAEGGSWGAWTAATATISGNKYNLTQTISGLDYQTTYTFQARAQDDLYLAYGNYVYSKEQSMSTLPVFDWSKTDFNFNTDVYMGKPALAIRGTTTSGESINAFQPCNSNNNCVLGYGGYDASIGATNLYGNDINMLTKSRLTINDGSHTYDLLGAARAMTNQYELSCSVSLGSNYSSGSATAYLVGNQLRMGMSATRSSARAAGDISNETVMTITITHSGKIRNVFALGFSSGQTGAPATFYSGGDTVIDDNRLSITVTLCGVAVEDNAWSANWAIPVTLNLGAY